MVRFTFVLLLCLFCSITPLLAQTLEQFEQGVTLPLIAKKETRLPGLEESIQIRLEDWADWDPLDTPMMFGSMAPEVNWDLDYSWITGNMPPFVEEVLGGYGNEIPLNVPIFYTDHSAGYPYWDYAYVDGFQLASQTAQCNRIGFPEGHLHTYEALRTPPVEYEGWPQINGWVLWDAPVGLGAPPIPALDQYTSAIDYVAGLTPVRCCAELEFDFGWSGISVECAEEHVCSITKEYQPLRHDQLGFPAGWCGDIDTTPPWLVGTNFPEIGLNIFETCCPFVARFGHVVDYYFPTQKISMSRQPFQSRYLNIDDVVDINSGQLKALKESLHDYAFDATGTVREVNDVFKKMKNTPDAPIPACILSGECSYELSEQDPLATPWEPPKLSSPSEPETLDELLEARFELLDFDEELFDLMVFSRGMNDRGFSRFFGEKQIEADVEATHYVPHVYPVNNGVVGQPFYATDHKFDADEIEINGEPAQRHWGFELAYWLHHSAEHDPTFRHYQSEEEADTNQPTTKKQHLDHPERCARHNAFTGRSPEEMLTAICDEGNEECKERWRKRWDGMQPGSGSRRDFRKTRCLSDVGEISKASRTRMHNTDFLFQTLVNGYQQYHAKFPHGSKSISLDLDLDRFHLLPSEKHEHFDPTSLQDIGAAWRGAMLMNEFIPAELNISLKRDLYEDNGAMGAVPFFGDLVGGACSKWSDLKNKERNRKHWDFGLSNVTRPVSMGAAQETTLEVFTLFSGCYGWPGEEEWKLDIWGLISIDFIIRALFSEFGPLGDLRVR